MATRTDIERLDWLEGHAMFVAEMDWKGIWTVTIPFAGRVPEHRADGGDLRAAIDAVMNATAGEEMGDGE